VPLSQAHELVSTCDDFFAAHEPEMRKHGIIWTRLLVVQKSMFGIEPIIYWQDRMNSLRHSVLSAANQEKWGSRPGRAEARAFALDLRRRLATVMERMRPYHYQAGKYYDYRAALAGESEWALLDDFKSMIDPARLINPGALGL
jgi:hypothetical protein